MIWSNYSIAYCEYIEEMYDIYQQVNYYFGNSLNQLSLFFINMLERFRQNRFFDLGVLFSSLFPMILFFVLNSIKYNFIQENS